MTTAEQLMEARDLISDSEHWIQGNLAADDSYRRTSVPKATKFCAMGVLCKANVGTDACEILERAAYELGYFSVPFLNDNTDHSTVMEMFDLAIRMAKDKE